jgi:hypothetical protein
MPSLGLRPQQWPHRNKVTHEPTVISFNTNKKPLPSGTTDLVYRGGQRQDTLKYLLTKSHPPPSKGPRGRIPAGSHKNSLLTWGCRIHPRKWTYREYWTGSKGPWIF